jgi:hypothetical protein
LEEMESKFLMIKLSLCLIVASCSQSKSEYQIDLVKGDKIDVINYTSRVELENTLKVKSKSEEDFQVEKAFIPRGGNLYIKETKYQKISPLLYVLVVGREGEYKCEDPEIKVFISKSGGLKYDSFSKSFEGQYGPTMNYNKTEFNCNIDKNINPPLNLKIIDFHGDTAAVYKVNKK